MHRCALDLGEDPWYRLASGRITGTFAWDSGVPLEATVRIRGAHSRQFSKKSVQVDFTAAPFPDGPPAGHTVRRLHLNADWVDPTMMRSALSYSLFADVGALAPNWRHVELSVSGEYAGLYIALESVDRDFLRRRGRMPGPIYYAVNRNANFGLINPFSQTLKEPLDLGYKPVHRADTAPLRRMIMELNLASERNFPAAVERWVDVKGYLKWLMMAVFVGNRDGFMHNYALYLDPTDDRFRIIPWDYDATWGIDINGRPARVDRVPLMGWNKLTARLMNNVRYRRVYRSMFKDALAGELDSTNLRRRIDKMAADLAPWIDKDQQKLGRDRSFLETVEALTNWIEKRRTLLAEQLDQL